MNDWKTLIQQRISNGTVGVEIGPFCSPLAAKREGYQTVVVGLKSREEMRLEAQSRGESDERIAAIEEVDVVGDASGLAHQLASDPFSFTGHRWHLTPAVLELLLFDLAQLELISLRPVQIDPTQGCDFLAIIQKTEAEPLTDAAASAQRHALCCRIENERAAISSLAQEQARRLDAQERELQELRSRLAATQA